MSKMISTRDAYGEALVEIGSRHPEVIVLDADLACATKTQKFAEKYPERFLEMGIAEQDMMGTAAGLAASGKIPFVSTFAIFAAGRAFEQVRNTICYPKLNVRIAATHAGITVGPDGGSHQAIEDIAIMRAIPNMQVIVPSDGVETKKAIAAALDIEGPVYIRLGRNPLPLIFNEDYNFEFGKITTLTEGADITLAATGIMVGMALEAAKMLRKQGISARVLDVHTIKPLDKGTIIKAAKETKCILTLEEHSIIGGLGSAVSETVAENHPSRVVRIGMEDCFGQSGSPDELLVHYGLTVDNIVKKVKELLAK